MKVLEIRHPRFSGESLIETMVAIFILVMGISAAVGLATYTFSSSTSITKQIVATGLAREGLEALRNMRDTNWLTSTLSSNCYDYTSGSSSGGNCYPTWLNQNHYPSGCPFVGLNCR